MDLKLELKYLLFRIRNILKHLSYRIKLFLFSKDLVWWDYTPIFDILAFQLRYMEERWPESMGANWKKELKRIRTARILCERLAKDSYPVGFSYTDPPYFMPGRKTKGMLKLEREAFNRDLDYLHKLLRKYVLTWWD